MQRRGRFFYGVAFLLAMVGILPRPARAIVFTASVPRDDTLWIQSDSCKTATPFCADSTYVYATIISDNQTFFECCEGDRFPPLPDSCCVDYVCPPENTPFSEIFPKWFILKANESGLIQIVSYKFEKHYYSWPPGGITYFYPCFNYYLWGPYDTPAPPCVLGLTSEKRITCHNSPCPINAPHIDTLTFYAIQGKFYIFLTFLTGSCTYDTVYSFFYQSNTGMPGAGVLSCEGINECTVFDITTQTTACNPTSNTFTLSGKIFFYNAPTSGTLVIWDNNTGYAVTFTAPFVSPIQYSIPGLPCDNTQHTVTAMFMEEAECYLSKTYQAPVLCPDAILSGGGSACQGDSIQIHINLSPFVQTPVNLALAINGFALPPMVLSGPFPLSFWVAQEGVYTIDTVYNSVCAGTPAGQANVTLWPHPQPWLGEDIYACEGRPVILDAGPGYVKYNWNTDETTQTIQVNSPGYYEVEVTDVHNCNGSDGINVQFVPQPQPVLIKHQ